MKPCKSADYFIKVNFSIVVDMKQGESKPFFIFQLGNFLYYKIKLIMKNRTDFRKSVHVETGVDPCLRYYRNYIISSTFCFGKKKQLTVENK